MGFLKPKVPEPVPPPNPAIAAPPEDALSQGGLTPSATSLISTSVAGLKRKASTQRTSLIGGA